MISFPNAKINLGLNVIAKRKDGFHNIESVFYPIQLSDMLEILESKKFSFSVSGLSIPSDETKNLAVRAYQILKKDFDLPLISIHLHKIIPTGAGLGGGSSDGAFMLKMLNVLFELYLDDAILESYAVQLGSDCPFFVRNKPMLARGRGEMLDDFDLNLEGYYLFLVKPEQGISTQEAYQLISPAVPEMNIPEIIALGPPETWRSRLKNDFEEAMFEKLSDFRSIKDKLYEAGALYASMTGSGSAFYGIFRDDPDLKHLFPSSYFTWQGIL